MNISRVPAFSTVCCAAAMLLAASVPGPTSAASANAQANRSTDQTSQQAPRYRLGGPWALRWHEETLTEIDNPWLERVDHVRTEGEGLVWLREATSGADTLIPVSGPSCSGCDSSTANWLPDVYSTATVSLPGGFQGCELPREIVVNGPVGDHDLPGVREMSGFLARLPDGRVATQVEISYRIADPCLIEQPEPSGYPEQLSNATRSYVILPSLTEGATATGSWELRQPGDFLWRKTTTWTLTLERRASIDGYL